MLAFRDRKQMMPSWQNCASIFNAGEALSIIFRASYQWAIISQSASYLMRNSPIRFQTQSDDDSTSGTDQK